MNAPLPQNEKERLESLLAYAVLDTPPEPEFDEVAKLVASVCGTPVGFISFLDASRQWFKARVGLNLSETHRDLSFCAYCILGVDVLEVSDTLLDPRFSENELVIGSPGIRFYAGAPLIDKAGFALGSLAVIDFKPRALTEDQREALRILSRQVVRAVEFRNALTHKAQKVLQESAERNRAMLSAAFDGILAINQDGLITEFNPAAERMFGYRAEEILGQEMAAFLIPEQLRERHREGFRRYLETGSATLVGKRVEFSALRRDGTEFPVEISLQRADLTDRVLVIGYLHDLTERKRAEEEQRRLETQLRQSQKMETIGVLAGGIAHDFNNVLQRIQGFTSLALEETTAPGCLGKHLHQVQVAVESASQLTRNLLLFSRRDVPQFSTINISSVVRDLLGVLEHVLGKNIRLEYSAMAANASVNADEAQIRQMLLNVCLNSRDAMPDGGKLRIEVRNRTVHEINTPAFPWAKTGPYVEVTVSDEGCGMSQDTLSRMFEPFFTTKSQGQGAGLGLSVVYGIVRHHEGFIEVESEPEKGCVFRILLPAIAVAAERHNTVLLPSATGGSETILLVDDEPGVRRASQLLLERSGYRVIVAEDGLHAVELFKQHAGEIKLVLSDVVMPGLSGFEAAERILQIKPVPLLFCSGYAASALRAEQQIPPGVQILAKPYSPAKLRSAVRETLNAWKTEVRESTP